jgi:streptogramin lyase
MPATAPPPPAQSDAFAAKPDAHSRVVEFPLNAKHYDLIAADGAGNEWTGAADPPMLIAISESTHFAFDFDLPKPSSEPFAVALGRNGGAMWFTETYQNKIGRIDLANDTITEYNVPCCPYQIALGSDGAL